MISNITIVFSNFCPKIHKYGNYGPKFKDYFCTKFAFRKVRGCGFQIYHTFFQSPAQNTRARHFLSEIYSCSKFCNQTKLMVLISNMPTVFLSSSPSYLISRIFDPKFQDLYFCAKLCSQTNLRALVSNMTIVFFKCLLKNTQIRYFCSKMSGFFVLYENLHFGKCEAADFKYDKKFLNLLPKTPK